MTKLFPELDEADARGPATADEQAPSAPEAMGPPPRKATLMFERILGLPGRFTARGPCRVLRVEMPGPDRLAINLGGGLVPPCTIYIVEGHAEQTMATTAHLSLIVRGTDGGKAVELLVKHAAFRLQNATFALLARIAMADPEVIRAASQDPAPTMPGLVWPPNDVDVEYLNSIGFGYSPPDAWRNFMQGHENHYGGIENARGYCQRVSGSVVNINHTEIECYYSAPPQHNGSVSFWNHALPDLASRDQSRGEHLELFSDLGENDVIKGGQLKLDRVFSSLAESGRQADVVVVTSTCTTTVIGDDVGGSVERMKRKSSLKVLNMAESGDIKVTLFNQAKARPGFFEVKRRDKAINLVGMPHLLGHLDLLALLGEAGVEINARLLPEIDAVQIDRYLAAELEVLYDWAFLDASYHTMLSGLPIRSIRPPLPFGVAGTRAFLSALADGLGRPGLFDEALARRLEQMLPSWEKLGREASGYRLGFVGEERAVVRFFETRQVLGIPVLQLLEEMGFGLDFFLVRSKGPKPTAEVVTRGTRRTRYVETAGELEHAIRSSEAAAFYSEIFFDRRITRCGKNVFSLADFGRIGLEGSLEALRRMVAACQLPFYRTYASYLPSPFETGHLPRGEHAHDG